MRRKRVLLLSIPVLLVLAGFLLRGNPGASPPGAPPELDGETRTSPPPLPAAVEAASRETPDEPGKPCEIVGEVKTHAGDWPPVPDALIRAWRLDDRGRATGPITAECRSGADGAFRLPLPAPGRYFLQMEAPGHAMESARARAPGRYTFTPRPAVRVEVLVTDEEGNPVAGAVVLRRPDEAVHTTEIPCDRNGRAEIDWNTFDHIGARRGELGSEFRRRSPRKGGGPIRIPLVRTWRVGGTVVDESGSPVAAAWLELRHEGSGDRQIRAGADGGFLFEGVVDGEDGGFLFEGVVAMDRVELQAWADGFAEHRRSVVKGDREVRIVLRPPVALRGTVLDHDGRPVAAAKVQVDSSMGHRQTLTDDAGEFSIEGFDPTCEIREIEAELRPKLQSVRRPGPVPLSVPVELRFPPTPASWLVVRVVDDAGNPLAGVTCRGKKLVQTDEDGLAILGTPSRAGAEVEIQLHRFGEGPWKRTVPVMARKDAPPHVVTAPGSREVKIRAVDPAGRVIPGAKAEFQAIPYQPAAPRKGPLAALLLEQHYYIVRISADGYTTVQRAVLVAEGTKTVEFVLRPAATIRGRTTSSFVIMVGGSWERHPVGKDGSFSIVVPAGVVTLTALDPGQRPRAHTSLEIRHGETRDVGELPPVERTEVTGVVTDEAGEPLAGATLVLRCSLAPQGQWGDSTRGDGAFTFPAASAGEWILIAAKEGRAADVRVFEAGAASTKLRLACPRGEAVLRVRVSGVGARQTHHLRFPGSRIPLRWPFRVVWAEGDDRIIEYRGLTSGEVTFLLTLYPASGDETSVVERTVSLAVGETTEIEVRVP